MKLFLDIETAPQKEWEQLTDYEQYLFMRNFYKDFDFEKDKLGDKYDYNEVVALHPEFSKIICISLAYIQNDNVVMHSITEWKKEGELFDLNEELMLLEFAKIINKTPNPVFIGHNLKGFDLPFLIKRFWKYEIQIPHCMQIIGKKPWEILHEDTSEMYKLASFGSKSNLELVCYHFGLENPKEDVSGGDVRGLYLNKEYDRIQTYCEGDVHRLIEVYHKMK